MESRIKHMTEMVAFSVGLGLSSGDFVSVSKAVRWAQQDPDLTFIAVLDEEFFEIAVTNPNNIKGVRKLPDFVICKYFNFYVRLAF